MNRARPLTRCFVASALLAAGCSIGEGIGNVRSDPLFIEGCWNRVYDLEPTFFAANPYQDDLSIRIQRGEESTLVSNGVTFLVHDITEIRATQLNQPIPLALPAGIAPLGFAPPTTPRTSMASMTLYMNDDCNGANASLSAIGGWIEFKQLFSGNPNENRVENRRTVGSFEAQMIDPRDAMIRPNPGPGEEPYFYPLNRQSTVTGDFEFVFHRGTPAQPFP